MNIPFQYYKKIDKQKSAQKVQQKKMELLYNLDETRKEKIRMMEAIEKLPKDSGKYFFRMKNFFSGNDVQTEINNCKMNLKNLSLDYERSYSSFLEINSEYFQVRSSPHQLKYIIQRYLAVVMIILGLQRIFSTSVNLIRGRKSTKTDIVVLIVSNTLKIFNVRLENEQYQELVDNVYFGFFGILVFTNINSFVQNFFKFINFIFKLNMGRFISNETILLFSAQIIGVYIISSFYMIIYKISDAYTGSFLSYQLLPSMI